MRPRSGRRLAAGALLVSALPTLAALALVRPAAAAPAAATPLARYALTASGAAVTSSGTLDAGGGLLLTDQGAATVSGRLDNSPSSRSMAVAAEPGTTARTLSASGGGPTPPGAAAQFPGGPDTMTDATLGMTTAHATMTAADATATATPATTGAGDAATATEQLTRDTAGQVLGATVASDSGTVTVAGVLTLGSVIGTAAVSRDAGGHHATAGITVAGASVAGQSVTIDATGVHAAGQSTGGLLPAAPAPVADLLAQAGITVTVLAPVMTTTANSALADSGALSVRVVTPDVTSGLTTVSSATDVTLQLGRAVATVLDAPLVAAVPRPTAATARPTPSATPGTTRTAAPAASSARPAPSTAAPSSSPGTPGRPAVPGRTITTVVGGAAPLGGPPPAAAPAAPEVAAAPEASAAAPAQPALRPAAYVVLGRRLPATAALAGFGAWQLLTLGLATTGALVARRRGEPEEEHLCPCP